MGKDNRNLLLKEGDKVRMKPGNKWFHQACGKPGVIVNMKSGSDEFDYNVHWGGDSSGYYYTDEHIELDVPKEVVINNYQIF